MTIALGLVGCAVCWTLALVLAGRTTSLWVFGLVQLGQVLAYVGCFVAIS